MTLRYIAAAKCSGWANLIIKGSSGIKTMPFGYWACLYLIHGPKKSGERMQQ